MESPGTDQLHLAEYLHVDGFREPTFDSGLFENLVLKNSTKEFIKNLTQMYIRDSSQPPLHGEKGFKKVTQVHNSPRRRKADATWSADFVEGKGEGLTILLHGRPGVGKTYTAGKAKLSSLRERLLTRSRMHCRLYRTATALIDVLRHWGQAREH